MTGGPRQRVPLALLILSWAAITLGETVGSSLIAGAALVATGIRLVVGKYR